MGRAGHQSIQSKRTLGAILMLAFLLGGCASIENGTGMPPTPSFLEGEYSTLRELYDAVLREHSLSLNTLNSAKQISETESDKDFLERISNLVNLEKEHEDLALNASKMEENLRKAEEQIRLLNESLNSAEFAQAILQLPRPTEPELPTTNPAEPEDPALQTQSRTLTRNVYAPASIGRSAPQTLGGSSIVLQEDGLGNIYLSHRDNGHFTDQNVYMEIQQRTGKSPAIYLVLQVEKNVTQQGFDFLGVDISLAGSFLYSLPAAEREEELVDPSRQLNRIFISLNPDLVQALGDMAREERGVFILKGEHEEITRLVTRESAMQFQEIISTFLEMKK